MHTQDDMRDICGRLHPTPLNDDSFKPVQKPTTQNNNAATDQRSGTLSATTNRG